MTSEAPLSPPLQLPLEGEAAHEPLSTMDLPDEIWAHIFGFMSTRDCILVVPAVCRRWQRIITRTPELDLSFCCAILTEDIVAATLARYPYVRRIILGFADLLTRAIFAVLKRLAPNLTHISFSSCPLLPWEDFEASILLSFPHIRHLKLHFSPPERLHHLPPPQFHAAHHHPQQQHQQQLQLQQNLLQQQLQLQQNLLHAPPAIIARPMFAGAAAPGGRGRRSRPSSRQGLGVGDDAEGSRPETPRSDSGDALAASPRRIMSLRKVELDDYMHMDASALERLIFLCPNIEDLSLRSSYKGHKFPDACMHLSLRRLDITRSSLSDHALIALAKSQPLLEALTVRACADITSEGLQAVVEICPNIAEIVAGPTNSIGDSLLFAIVRLERRVSTLCLFNSSVTDAAVEAIALQGHIRKLVLPNSPITDRAILAFSDNNITTLRALNLFRCRNVTNTGVSALASVLHFIETLLLPDMKHISTACFLQALETARPVHLRHVNLNYCNVSDRGLLAVAQHCPVLSHICLVNCLNISLGAFTEFVSTRRGLEHLELDDCRQVTDEWLEVLAQRCPFLRHLGVAGCDKVTLAGLDTLFKGCQRITSLKLPRSITHLPASAGNLIGLNCIDTQVESLLWHPQRLVRDRRKAYK